MQGDGGEIYRPSTAGALGIDEHKSVATLSLQCSLDSESTRIQIDVFPESARRQYGLTERAEQLGWLREQITVIDKDQGKSGAGSAAAHGRDGFAELVSAVGLGEVGIVLALEVARLARKSRPPAGSPPPGWAP